MSLPGLVTWTTHACSFKDTTIKIKLTLLLTKARGEKKQVSCCVSA